jgi:hypothetical protein
MSSPPSAPPTAPQDGSADHLVGAERERSVSTSLARFPGGRPKLHRWRRHIAELRSWSTVTTPKGRRGYAQTKTPPKPAARHRRVARADAVRLPAQGRPRRGQVAESLGRREEGAAKRSTPATQAGCRRRKQLGGEGPRTIRGAFRSRAGYVGINDPGLLTAAETWAARRSSVAKPCRPRGSPG